MKAITPNTQTPGPASTSQLERPAAVSETVARLERRSTSLRDAAHDLNPIVAAAYRRRASELELEAWARRVISGLDQQLPAAA